MSFGISDLVTVVVIEDGLRHLAANPTHLHFIMSPFVCDDAVRKLVGTQYIDQVIEFVTKRKIFVTPVYQADEEKLPQITTIASQGEGQQFIGDYGYDLSNQRVLPPHVYTQFDVKNYQGDTLFVPPELHIEEKIWRNVYIRQGDFVATCIGIIPGTPGEETAILLDRDVPAKTSFTGWTSESAPEATGYVVNSSQDDVEVQVTLTTNGDYSIHRLLSIVTRYCLKRGRGLFNQHGMQVASFNQGMPLQNLDNDKLYQTTFTVRAKVTEHWIEKEYRGEDPSGRLDIDLIATEAGHADVDLGDA
jgi:hypothetical protein